MDEKEEAIAEKNETEKRENENEKEKWFKTALEK